VEGQKPAAVVVATVDAAVNVLTGARVPFLRLSDTYIDHPKFLALTAGAFRLWHEGLAFCRKHRTDGIILTAALQRFHYVTVARVAELTTPYTAGAQPLWRPVEAGYQVHDYLEWNLSKADEDAQRASTAERVRKYRQTHARNGVRNAFGNAFVPSTRISTSTSTSTNTRTDLGTSRDARARQNREIGRIFLHRWQQDALISTLGDYAETFELDVFLDQLNTKLAGKALPKDVWPLVKAELDAEIRRRGLAVAEPPQLGKQSTRLAVALAKIEAES
jgi:hypothetical protein